MTIEHLCHLLEERQYKELKEQLEAIHPVDIAELMEELKDSQIAIVFRILPKDMAGETFAHMESDTCEMLLNILNAEEIKDVMEELYLDDAVDIMEELPANVVDKLLDATDEDTRARINELLNYPEDSAGSIMTVEYISLRKNMTVAEAIEKIRAIGIMKETIYTCYVTERRKLIGYVDVKDLLSSGDQRIIEDIMDTNILNVHTHDDQEEVVLKIKKYGLVAIPVVDNTFCMVGIVTVDDAMLVLQEENTEDIARMAAINPSEEDYFETNVFEHSKSRIVWLLVLMLTSTITGIWIDQKQAAFENMVLVVSFMPMIMGTGGNSGSQSAALMVRGLSINEIEFEDIFKIIWKEIRVAFLVSLVLGIANGIRIYFMYNHNFAMALTVGVTLLFTIVLAKFVGCTLPLIAKKLKMDPALMAGPLITTIVDAGSMLIYFTIVTIVFN